MIAKKQKILSQIKLLYLLIFALGSILIAPTHFFPAPSFMTFRFPHYLEMMGPFIGISWPLSFEIYHYVIFALIVVGSLNILGILFYPKFIRVALFSSLIGAFLISLILLFLFLVFIKINPSTAIIYGLFFIVLLTADLLTFETLTMKARQKEGSCE